MAPRINTYQQQTSARAGLGAGPTGNLPRRITNSELMAGVASDLAQVGGQLANQAQKKEEEDAAAWSAEQLSKARLDWTKQQIEREQNAPPGASGYAGQITKDYDQYADNILNAAPTETARKYLANRLIDMKTNIVGRGMEFEAKSRLKDRVDKIGSAIDSSRITVDLDPSQYQVALAENLSTLDALDIPETQKSAIKDDAVQSLSFASVASRMRNNPGDVLSQLSKRDGGGASDVGALNADNRLRLRTQAEAEIKRRQVEAKQAAAISRAELAFRVQDAQAAYMQGLQYESPPTAGELKASYGAEKGQQIFNRLNKSQQFGIDVQEYATLPVSERAEWLKSRVPASSGMAKEGYAEDAQMFGQLYKNIENINKQMAEDGAGYAVKYAPEVSQAWQGVMSATPEEAPVAYQAYAEAVKGEQARLGITSPSILPKQFVGNIAAAFKDPANAGPRQKQMIDAMKSNWGDSFPEVFKQVSEYVPNSVKIIASGVDDDTATLLSGIASVDTKTLKAPLEGAEVTTMNNELKAELADFGKTFAAQGAGGITTFNSIYDESYRGALQLMATGVSASEAAKTMATRLSANYNRDGNLQIDGGLRVPNTYDMDTVQEGAQSALESLTLDDVMVEVPPGLTDDASNRLLRSILRSSQMVTNTDETGVFLMFNGAAILNKDGQPLQMTFDELTTVGGARAVESYDESSFMRSR